MNEAQSFSAIAQRVERDLQIRIARVAQRELRSLHRKGALPDGLYRKIAEDADAGVRLLRDPMADVLGDQIGRRLFSEITKELPNPPVPTRNQRDEEDLRARLLYFGMHIVLYHRMHPTPWMRWAQTICDQTVPVSQYADPDIVTITMEIAMRAAGLDVPMMAHEWSCTESTVTVDGVEFPVWQSHQDSCEIESGGDPSLVDPLMWESYQSVPPTLEAMRAVVAHVLDRDNGEIMDAIRKQRWRL
jgi:hypothetical protein